MSKSVQDQMLDVRCFPQYRCVTICNSCYNLPRQVSRVVESGSGFSSSSRSRGVIVKRGEEGEVTEKREEDKEVGSGLVNDPAWRTPPEAGAGGRNWGRTREGGMCSWGRPAKVSTLGACSKTRFRFEHSRNT